MDPTTTAAPSTDTPAPGPDDPITIVCWRDELVERHTDAIATDSQDMLLWWTPILGPTATLMAHQLGRLTRDGRPHTFARGELSQTFGLGASSGRLDRALERLCHFGVARLDTDTLAVRLAMGPMSVHYQQRLPAYLAHAYQHRT